MEASCPEGTFHADYVRDYYETWSVLCIGELAVKDMDDVINCSLLVVGQALIGLLVLAVYRKMSKPTPSAHFPLEEIKVTLTEITTGAAANSAMCTHKFNELMELNKGLRQDLEMVKISVLGFQDGGKYTSSINHSLLI